LPVTFSGTRSAYGGVPTQRSAPPFGLWLPVTYATG
jgi:hypothetical protein